VTFAGPTIRTLPLAEADAVAIWASIAEDGPAQADGFLDLLEKKLRLLATIPAMSQHRPDLAPNLRSYAFGDYCIFFRPIDCGIEAVRILYETCDTAGLSLGYLP